MVSDSDFQSTYTVDAQRFELSNALQTTLEFKKLLTIFSSKINSLIPHNAYAYSNTLFDMEINQGVVSKYSCSYALKAGDQELGELTLMRNHKFVDEELDLLENLLCLLLYPLKNTTLYHQALKMAATDQLTQTLNRVSFNDTVKREMNSAKLNGTDLSIIFLDIDHFKDINDQYGHDCGDSTLVAVARLIKETLRKSDTIFRFGGEEFVILVSQMDLENAELLARRIRTAIECNILVYDMKPIKVTASLGVSTLHSDDSFDTFIKRADHAMYKAKGKGRNQVVLAY
ncbi:GGDEF domain-containing protein [Crenothrix sp.]|uniref:GGDEF domain-containing protein n=1 Tax=Crenothrix sp. TaxID=3100433 RepID=UPI00374DDD81